jgi:hypothetical protein
MWGCCTFNADLAIGISPLNQSSCSAASDSGHIEPYKEYVILILKPGTSQPPEQSKPRASASVRCRSLTLAARIPDRSQSVAAQPIRERTGKRRPPTHGPPNRKGPNGQQKCD